MRPHRISFALLTALLLLAASPSAHAMPMFSRKYHMECTGCHDSPTYPRLNDVGYKFRRAGFRMPENIGKEELSDFNVGDYFAARVQSRYTVSHTKDERTSPSTSSTKNLFEMREITLYPITGSFMKYWATETEISLAPDETAEIENGYLRGVWGNQDLWLEARLGLFHPFEGFGGSDRPVGVSRPLFETNGANQAGDTLARVWGIDQVGFEAGLEWRNTSLSAAVVNGLNTEIEGGQLVGVGITPDSDNHKDLWVFANQLIGGHSGVSALWVHGQNHLPVDPAGFLAGTTETTFTNNYDRLAAFASLGISRLVLMAGGELGFDQTFDPATGDKSRFKSAGAFAEADLGVANHIAVFGRFDWFDPSTKKDNNELLGATIGASIYHDWVYVLPELTWRQRAGAAGDRTDLAGLIHAIAIY